MAGSQLSIPHLTEQSQLAEKKKKALSTTRSETMRRLWADPEYHARQLSARQLESVSPEARACGVCGKRLRKDTKWGFCQKHKPILYRADRAPIVCKADGCDRFLAWNNSNGLCEKHLDLKTRKRLERLTARSEWPTCKIEGCKNRLLPGKNTTGLCVKHYRSRRNAARHAKARSELAELRAEVEIAKRELAEKEKKLAAFTKGRPRNEEARAMAIRLRSEGKSWEALTLACNRALGLKLKSQGYRYLVNTAPTL